MSFLSELKFDERGLLPTIVQDYKTNEVLMLGYSDAESAELTLQKKLVHFYSRSRSQLWLKGETSGNYLRLVKMSYDCDKDTLLISADPSGPVCHTGSVSCFYSTAYENEEYPAFDSAMLFKLYEIVRERKNNPKEGSYTNYLFDSGIDKILKKVGEESAETIIAAKNNSREEIIYEVSDLLYHLTVLLNHTGVELEEILKALEERHNS